MRPIISAPPTQQMDTTPTEGVTQKVRSFSSDCTIDVAAFGTAAGLCAVGMTCAACSFLHKMPILGVGGCIVATVGLFSGFAIKEHC